MTSAEEIYCEPSYNLVVNHHIYLGEGHFKKLDDGFSEID